MLYQPSNITPSAWAGEGQNVVAVADPVSISWQVNGNSPMTGFTISIFPNTGDAATDSVQVASIDGTVDALKYPNGFYPTDGNGNVQFYNFVSENTWSYYGLSDGNNYKYKIAQKWVENGTTNTVEQNSFSSFITRTKPTISWNPSYSMPIFSPKITFTSSMILFSQAQGDAIKKIRWIMSVAQDEKEVELEDTGDIYTSNINWSFGRGIGGLQYYLTVKITTINDVTATLKKEISFSYSAYQTGDIETKCKDNGVGVEISGMAIDIPLTEGQDYTIENETAVLGEDGRLEWDNIENVYLTSGTWGNIVWRGVVYPDITAVLFSVTSQSFALSFGVENGIFTVQLRDFTTSRSQTFTSTTPITVATRIGLNYIAQNESYGILQCGRLLDNTYTVSPTSGQISQTLSECYEISAETVIVRHKQVCYYAGISKSYSVIQGNVWDSGTLFLSVFSDESLNAGTISQDASKYAYYIIPQDVENKKSYAVPTAFRSFTIHSEKNIGSAFSIFLRTQDGEYFINTDAFWIPCCCNNSFWLLSAKRAETDDNVYIVNKIWKFSNNADNGTVTNNNNPNWLTNFTPYRLRQPTKRMGRSGTLTALLSNAINGKYNDTAEQMDELFSASQSNDTFFLKDPKGNLYMVGISAPIQGSVAWGTKTLQTTISISWEEIGDASKVSLISYGDIGSEN